MSLFIDETPERKIERLSREIDFIETELRKSIIERQELVAYWVPSGSDILAEDWVIIED